MKSFEQLAKSAYEAYRKSAIEQDEEGLATHSEKWGELDAVTRQCWVAAVQKTAQELSTLH